ncbi:Uncharacterised protein [Acinetobacter baumannii]|nr:Uncharacterised protein [Acinetobacter baumannii]
MKSRYRTHHGDIASLEIEVAYPLVGLGLALMAFEPRFLTEDALTDYPHGHRTAWHPCFRHWRLSSAAAQSHTGIPPSPDNGLPSRQGYLAHHKTIFVMR